MYLVSRPIPAWYHSSEFAFDVYRNSRFNKNVFNGIVKRIEKNLQKEKLSFEFFSYCKFELWKIKDYWDRHLTAKQKEKILPLFERKIALLDEESLLVSASKNPATAFAIQLLTSSFTLEGWNENCNLSFRT